MAAARPNRLSALDAAEEVPRGPLAQTSRSLQDKSCNMAVQVCLRGRLMKLHQHSCVTANEVSAFAALVCYYSVYFS